MKINKLNFLEIIDSPVCPVKTELPPNLKPTNIIRSGELDFVNHSIGEDSKPYPLYFVLDLTHLWCKESQESNSFSWRIEMNHVKMITPKPQLSQSTQTNTTSSLTIKLFYRENYEWHLKPESTESTDQWVSAFTRVLIRTDIHNRFRLYKVIGQGSTAVVHLAVHLSSKTSYAIKEFNKRKTESRKKGKLSLSNEISILRNLSHPNISKLCEVHETDSSVYLVFEYCGGGDLQTLLNKGRSLEKSEISNIMTGLLTGLDYLQNRGLIHRDIKPANILIKKTTMIKAEDVVISDFGFSTEKDIKDMIVFECGTPGHLAPEIIGATSQDEFLCLHSKCDIYSAGVVYFMLLTRTNPFATNSFIDAETIMRENLKSDINFKMNSLKKINPNHLLLLKSMLTKEQTKRPTANQCLKSNIFNSSSDYIERKAEDSFQEFIEIEEEQYFKRDNLMSSYTRIRCPSILSRIVRNDQLDYLKVTPSIPDYFNDKQTPRVNCYKSTSLLSINKTGSTQTKTNDLDGNNHLVFNNIRNSRSHLTNCNYKRDNLAVPGSVKFTPVNNNSQRIFISHKVSLRYDQASPDI